MRKSWLLGAGAFGFLFALGFGGMMLLAPVVNASGDTGAVRPSQIRVIDGDTIEYTPTDTTYRLVNIDTPETGSRASCVAERDLGDAATEAVRELVAQAQRIDLRPTGRLDQYGRTIAYVLIDGQDLGEALIAQDLARPWRGRRLPWCDPYGGLLH